MSITPSISQSTTEIIFTNNFATLILRKSDGRLEAYKINEICENILTTSAHFTYFSIKDEDGEIQDIYPTANYEINAIEDDKAIKYLPNISGTVKSTTEGRLIINLNPSDNHNGVDTATLPKMVVSCKVEPNYFVFELEELVNVNDLEISHVTMALIHPYGEDYGGFVGAVHKSNYVHNLVALNKETRIYSTEQTVEGMYAFLAQSYSAIDLMAMKFALVSCPKSQWVSIMENIETDFTLPHHAIDGIWDKQHPDIDTSYLFVDLTVNNVNKITYWARLGGFKYIMPYVDTWSSSLGTYGVNGYNYPAGLDLFSPFSLGRFGRRFVDSLGQFKSLVRHKIHMKGLKIGLHCYAFAIGKNDPIVASAHPGLAKEDSVKLAKSISVNDQFIELSDVSAEEKEYLERYKYKYINGGEKDFIIESEIITCDEFIARDENTGSPPKLKVSARGQYGTSIISHDKDTSVIYHLPEKFGKFLADPESDLPDIIAQNFAYTFNAINAGMVFLDCDECQERLLQYRTVSFMNGGDWYLAPNIAEKYREKIGRGLIVQGSSLGDNQNYSWHLYSRGTGGDYVTIGVEGRMENIRLAKYGKDVFMNSFFPMELGWIGLLAKIANSNGSVPAENASYPSTTIDEIEYQMNRALGYNLPISLESVYEKLKANGSTNNIFKLIGTYEKLRKSEYFPESMLEKLRQPDTDFIMRYGLAKEQYKLVKSSQNQYGFQRQAYLEKVLTNNENWEFENPFHMQPLKVKITALPKIVDRENGENKELLIGNLTGCDASDKDNIKGCGPHVKITIDNDGLIKANYSPLDPNDRPYSWAMIPISFANLMDLSKHKAIEIKVTGDCKKEVLAIHLLAKPVNYSSPMERQFQFEVNFSTTKTIFFPLPGSNSFYDHEPWYGSNSALRYFNWSMIIGMNIYIKKIPRNQEVSFTIHSIKALEQDLVIDKNPNPQYELLRNPKIRLRERQVEFPTTLNPRFGDLNAEPWDYLVYEGRSSFRKYNGNNVKYSNLLQLVKPCLFGRFSPNRPQVKRGRNTLEYRHNGDNLSLVQILLEEKPMYLE